MKLKTAILFLGSLAAGAMATPDFGMYGFATLDDGTTGGDGGTVVKVSSFTDFKNYAEDVNTPYVILVNGEINTGIAVNIDEDGAVDASGSISTTYGEIVQIGNNKTIVGLGSTAFLNRVGLVIQNKHNIIIRNLKITMTDVPISKTDENKVVAWRDGAEVVLSDPDCIGIEADSAVSDWAGKSTQGSYNIWIDHCELYNGATDDKDRYDGLLDAKNNIYNATFSWNYFHDHHKASLLGNSDGDSLRHEITIHHNFYKNIASRQPMLRYAMTHFYNNYVEGDSGSGDGTNSRIGDNLYIEKNHYASLSKAVFPGDSSSTKDDKGSATIVGNKYDGCATFMSSGCNSKTMRIYVNPGATLTTSDTSNVKLYGEIKAGSFKPSDYYSYTTDDVEDVAVLDSTWSGVGKISTTEYETNVTLPTSSSSSETTSSSSVTSSSSETTSSSSTAEGTATLSKHGSGSSTQTVVQGASLDDFYYSWTVATSVEVSGTLPTGVTAAIDNTALTVTFSGTVASDATVGDYAYTVTTVGATTNTSKSGVITVTSSTSSILATTDNDASMHAFVQSGTIVVQAQKGTSIRLFSPLGTLLYTGRATEAETLLPLQLSKGAYLLQMGHKTQKLILQ